MTTSPSFAQMANNQSISLLSALRANTPPTKGQTTSHKFLTLSIFFLLSFFFTANAWGAEVKYTVSSTSAVTTSGTALDGSSADYSSTYGTKCQLTSGNSMTLTLSGYDGCTITGLTLSMKSNTEKGAGNMSMKIGSTTAASISTAKFNTNSWNGSWSTSYVNVTPSVTAAKVGNGEKIVIKISATENSLYCQSFTLIYEPSSSGGDTGDACGWVETELDDVQSSDVIVITMTNSSGTTYAMSNNNGTSSAPAAVEVGVGGTSLTSEITDNIKWNVGGSNDAYTFYPNGDASKWLYCTSTNNGVRVGTNAAKAFTIDATSGYLKHTGTSRYIGVYNNADWRCYTNTTGNTANQTLKFYKYVPCGPTTHTVTFNANGHGTAPDTQTVESGNKATEPTAPTATGYTFGGWYSDQACTNEYDFNTSITADIPLYAKWTAIQTTITLNANGGSGNTASVKATYDSSTLNPSSITNPTKTGCTFGGWYSGEGGTGSLVINTSGKLQANVSGFTGTNGVWKATTNKTLYAKWTANTYTVTLDNQGATTAGAASVTATYNAAMPSIANNLPQKTGYTFNGYFDAASGGTKYYNADGTSAKNWDKEAATTTLYAQWTCETPVFDIKIKNDNPVVFSGESIELTVVGSNIAADATYQWYKKNGATYDELAGKTTNKLTIGETTANDAGNYKCRVTNGTCSAENDYTVKMYHIKGLKDVNWTTPFEFEKNGNVGTFTIELAATTTYYFKLNDGSVWYWNEGTMTHDNCTGWVIEQEGADTQGKANTGITTTASGTYTFTLDYSDPSKPTLSVTYPQKKMVYFNPNMWADGATEVYTVYSWQEGSNGSFVTMTSVEGCGNTNIYQAEIDASHNKLLFIRWNQAHTAWDNNRWNQSIDLDYQTNGQYKIDDWGNNSELYWKDGAKKSWASHEKTFTPNYTVTFDANGHGTAPDAQCVAKNGKATQPTAPTATGYTFDGWYKEAGCTNAYDFNAEVTSNITLYAKWNINSYTVTWNPAEGNWSSDANDIVQTYEYGELIEAPEKPTYDCHEFVEWNPAYTVGKTTMPDEDLVFTATWKKLSYTITFKNYNGTVLQTSTVECGETPSYTGATPTKAEDAQYTYTFKGWSSTIAPATQDQFYTAQFNQTTRSYTVTWYDGTGNAHKTQTADYNTTVALPTTNPDPCDNQYPHFIGWTADPINGSTTIQPALVENVKVTGDCDYYAVFAKGEGGSSDYKLVTSAPVDWSGTYLIVNTDDKKAWKGSATSDNGAIDVTITNNTIPSNATTDNETFTIATMTGGYSIKGTSGKYISGTNGSNATNYNDAAQLNTISIDNNNNVTITSNTSVLRQNNSNASLFRYYKSSTYSSQHPIQLYKKGSGVNYTFYITTCCTSWTAPTLTYTTPLNAEERQTAQPQFGNGTTYGNPTYTSSKPSVLSVDEATGEVTAVSKGTATITVTWEGNETYCSVSATSNTITVNGSYSVTFHSNGGTGTMEPQKADPLTQLIAKLNKNEFTKAGYVFVGWKDASGNAYTDEQENITLTKNLTLYAQWAAIVTLNDAGNVTTTHPETVGGSITLEDGANACDPYEFVGWTAVATGDWNEGINEPALVATTYTPNAPTTLYAVYKIQSEGNANAFKLSFEGGNGKTYYVGSYNSSPYLRGYSNITKEEAVTFIRTKMYPDNDTKYYIYMEHKSEYLYYNGTFNSTSSTPDENQGWVFHTVGDKIKLQSTYSYDPEYLSFSDRDQETINMGTNASGSEFNMLSAVTSTYVASPLCNQEIEIIFETGNGDFVDNAPATNPLTVSRGDVITLPTCEYPGYEFMGWLKDEQQLDPSDIIGTYYTGDYTVDGVSSTITFYAYYKVIPEEVEFTGKDDVELLMYYYDGTENYYYAVSHAAERGELSSKQNCFNATTWTFTNVGNMQYYIQDETGKYLGAVSDSDNDFSLSNTPKIWNFTLVNGLWKMVCEDSPSRALMYISEGNRFTNAAISNEGNGVYSYVTLGICPYPTYTTNPVLSQGFSITNTAMVTSASGQKVKATSALTLETRNIELPCTFTISAPNITFYDTNGNEITELTSSAASEQFELHFAYKPTAENTIEYPTITIVDDEMKIYTIKNRIYARSLPATFAVVAKVGNLWYALPSQGLNSTTPPAAYPIEVDDMADPTAVTAVPANADWSLRQVYEASRVDATKDRFVANGENFVFVNNEGTPKALNASASGNYLLTDAQYSGYYETNPGLYEWTPTTSDLETYTLTNAQRTDRTLNVSINNIFGVHSDNKATTEVRFLPIQNRYTPMAAQVVEWKENSVVVMYNGNPAQTASVTVNAGAAQETTLSSAQKDIAVYELAANGLATNPTQSLSITIGTEKAILPIPYLVSSETTDLALLPGATVAARQEVAKVADLVVLNGATLTAAGAKGNPYKFRNATIYGGGKLVIPSEKGFGVASLTLRAGGIADAGKYDYVYPQFELRGTFTNSAAKINYDYITDYDHWFHLVLPFSGDLGTIKYPTEFYGANVAANNTGSWQIKRYAGEIRATGNYNAWKDIEDEGATSTTAGQGYIFWGAPKKVTVNGKTTRQKWGIQRITMSITAPNAMTAENGDKAISELSSYANVPNNSRKDNDQGWNLIGNPYMVNLTDMATTGLHACKLVEVIDPATGKWNGKWEWNDETNIRYLTIPSDHFDTYTAKTVAQSVPLIAGRAFFVQLDGEANGITFAAANRASLMPALLAENNDKPVDIETGIILNNETLQDEVNFWIKDGKTNNYEYNADYPKTPNNNHFNIYGVHTNGDLSWVATSPEYAAESMPIGYQVPAAGTFTLSVSETYYSENLQALFVTDHEASPEVTTNLVDEDYTFYVNQAETNNTRFTVSIILKPDKENTPTGVDNINTKANQPIKFLYQDKIYILRNGMIYDTTGKQVITINK